MRQPDPLAQPQGPSFKLMSPRGEKTYACMIGPILPPPPTRHAGDLPGPGAYTPTTAEREKGPKYYPPSTSPPRGASAPAPGPGQYCPHSFFSPINLKIVELTI